MEKSVNQRIKELRLSFNLTQKEFADSLDIKQATISAIENNKAGYSVQLLNKICEVYKIDLIYFFQEDFNKKPDLKEQLLKFQGVIIGKLGEKVWSELEPYYPKCRQAV